VTSNSSKEGKQQMVIREKLDSGSVHNEKNDMRYLELPEYIRESRNLDGFFDEIDDQENAEAWEEMDLLHREKREGCFLVRIEQKN